MSDRAVSQEWVKAMPVLCGFTHGQTKTFNRSHKPDL